MVLCVILYTGIYTDYLISSKTLNFEHLNFFSFYRYCCCCFLIVSVAFKRTEASKWYTICDSVQWIIHPFFVGTLSLSFSLLC